MAGPIWMMPALAKPMHITVTHGCSGFFAVMVCWNTDLGANNGFWEPYLTGIGRYESRTEAVSEGKEWAKDNGLEFRG